jgi:hypothetical protein
VSETIQAMWEDFRRTIHEDTSPELMELLRMTFLSGLLVGSAHFAELLSESKDHHDAKHRLAKFVNEDLGPTQHSFDYDGPQFRDGRLYGKLDLG